jgi:hypothetical protein
MAGPFASFFSTGSAWGHVAIDAAGLTLCVEAGRLELDRLTVTYDGTTYDFPAPDPTDAGGRLYLPFPSRP